MFSLKTLGPPKLLIRGESVRLFRKSLALLTYLGIESSRPHERGILAEFFWPGLPETKAEHSLSQALYSLRKILDPFSSEPSFVLDRNTVQFNPKHGCHVDALLLLVPPAGCPVYHDSWRCRDCAQQRTFVLREVQGPFLSGLSLPDCEEFEEWAIATGESLLSRCRQEAMSLVALLEEDGNRAEAVVLLESVLKMNPLDESLVRLLMTLHAKDGNIRAADLVYESCRQALKKEMDLLPEEETLRLVETIRTEKNVSLSMVSGERSSPFSFERRPATALSIEILENGDPEGIPSPMTGRILSLAMEKVRELGGVVLRTHGHSFLSFFGLKGSPEGAVRKAARATVELRNLIQNGKDGLTSRIDFRGGIHAGFLFQGASLVSPDPSGSVSRPAMALAMQAEVGEVLLDQSSARLLKGEFRTAPAGKLRVLGKWREGVRLIGVRGRDESEPAGNRPPCPLFGRDRERTLFRSLLEKESGGLLVVEGEAGIGKTVLVRSFVEEALSRNYLVRRIECGPQYGDSPYFPMIRMMRELVLLPEECGGEEGFSRIRSYVRTLGFSGEQEMVALLAGLFSLPPHPDYPVVALPPAAMRERISQVILSILKRRRETDRVLLLVEDLHWMDSSTKALLFRVISDPDLWNSILLVLTVRTGEGPDWLETIEGKVTLSLSPLGVAHGRKLVLFLAAGSSLPAASIDAVVRISDGVPLFIEELTRMVCESPDEKIPESRSEVPCSLSEVLASRIDRLATARVLLQRASVIGRTVPLDLLARLSCDPETTFRGHLEKGIRSGLIEKASGPSGEVLHFRHGLIQEAAYRSLQRTDQVALHRRVAETLVASFPERAHAAPEIVAHHFWEGASGEEAAEWFLKASNGALVQGALPEAEYHARRAVSILEQVAPGKLSTAVLMHDFTILTPPISNH